MVDLTAEPLHNSTSRLSTAPSNHGPKATTTKPENRTSNGPRREKSRLSPKQYSPAQLKKKKPGVNKKSKLQKQLEAEKKTPKMNASVANSLILALQIFPCIIPTTRMPMYYLHGCPHTTHVDARTMITRTYALAISQNQLSRTSPR
ncbi:hypothetical protein AZE42_04104 [Rhizopogon vesiculosus]|uniref:Uncharacterized protein n=1 Tax=Rhizopogon vesiculosus TaxID=180088 RepID=A0A1J8R891_9AGAM|nr:hypothetical protein AZE42_04104 [Rhizopogon vesiculosus]